MESKSAIKVGIVVLLAALGFWAAYGYFAHLNKDTYAIHVVFDNTRGLPKRSVVSMNGVAIGEVESVALGLDFKPKVTLAIQNAVKIPSSARFIITSGLLISNAQVNVEPGSDPGGAALAPGSVAKGSTAGALAQISPEAQSLVTDLSTTLQTIGPRMTQSFDKLNKILDSTAGVVDNFRTASASVKDLAADPKIGRTMRATLDDLKAMTEAARQTAQTMSGELRAVVKRNSGKFDELANGAIDLLQTFADTVDAARGAVTKLAEQASDPRLQQGLAETLDLARATMARFGQIASDIHSLTGDADVQTNLKSTVASMKRATEQGQQLIEKVSSVVSKINLPGGGPKFGIGKPEINIDLLARTEGPRYRSDVGVRVPIGKENAFSLGLYDFAETNKLNAQYETTLDFGAVRYGIYASKLGLGVNWNAGSGTTLVFDLYNPNRLQLDAKALVRLNRDAALWIGADSVLRRTSPVLGVRLMR